MGTLFPAGSLSNGRLHWPAKKHSGPENFPSHPVYAERRATYCTLPWESLISSALQQLQEISSLKSYMSCKSISLS